MSSLFFRPVAGTCLVPMATCRYLFTVCSIVESGTVRVGGGGGKLENRGNVSETWTLQLISFTPFKGRNDVQDYLWFDELLTVLQSLIQQRRWGVCWCVLTKFKRLS